MSIVPQEILQAFERSRKLASARATQMGLPGEVKPVILKGQDKPIWVKYASVVNSANVVVAFDQNGQGWAFCPTAPTQKKVQVRDRFRSRLSFPEEEVVEAPIQWMTMVQNGSTMQFWLCGHQEEPENVLELPYLTGMYSVYTNQGRGLSDFYSCPRINKTGPGADEWIFTFVESILISAEYALGDLRSTIRHNKIWRLSPSGLELLHEEDLEITVLVTPVEDRSYFNFGNSYWARAESTDYRSTSPTLALTAEATLTYFYETESAGVAGYTVYAAQPTAVTGSRTVTGALNLLPNVSFPFNLQQDYTATTSVNIGRWYVGPGLMNPSATVCIGEGRYGNGGVLSIAEFIFTADGNATLQPSGSQSLYRDQDVTVGDESIALLYGMGSNAYYLFGTSEETTFTAQIYGFDYQLIEERELSYWRTPDFINRRFTSNAACWVD